MKYLPVLLLFFLGTLTVPAQNLIPNGSFESTKKETNQRITSSREEFNQKAKHWYSPTNASPDLYQLAPDNDQYPPNFKMINPTTGRGMAGLLLSTPEMGIGCTFYKEYMQVKLKDTLIIGKDYLLEFWISPTNSGKQEIGVLLSEKPIYSDRCEALEQQPQFVFKKNLTQGNWQKVSYRFKPGASHSYLTVGNFEIKNYKKHSYCYVDDFELTPFKVTATIEETVLKKEQKIIDKPITELSIKEIFNPSTIRFEHGKATLLATSTPELNKLIAFLQAKQHFSIRIEGHTDNTGTTEFNQTLSINRAAAVRDYLVSKNIDATRLKTVGYGASQPIASNEDLEGQRLNRRVVFVLTDGKLKMTSN